MSYGREPCLSDFSGFLNEETILVNDPIFSREAVQDYATHPEKNLNKHKEIGNFATHSTKKVSMISPFMTANAIWMSVSHLNKKAYRKNAGFHLTKIVLWLLVSNICQSQHEKL